MRLTLPLALALVFTLGCPEPGPDLEPGPVDADGDGVTADLDCDDDNAAVFPGADELCNEIDDDCDGEVDDAPIDRRNFYKDDDEDGFGQDGSVTISCFLPEGHAEQGGDCADDDPQRNPGVDETCNEIDDDCNGEVDDSPVDGDPWYPDSDRDGYGGDAGRILACAPVGGHIPTGGDCDDSDETVNPEGQEICGDPGADEDCDGLVDDEDDSLTSPTPWYLDADEDGYGERDTPIFQCAEPADRIARGGDCRDDLPAVNPEAEEICGNEVDDDCNDHAATCGVVGELPLELADSVWEGLQGGAELGDQVFALPDRNGDGRAELGMSQSRWDAGRDSSAGRVALVNGPALGGSIRTVDHLWSADTQNMRLGQVVVNAGDIDGDGEPELWVSSTEGVFLLDIDDTIEDAPLVIAPSSGLDDSLGDSLEALTDVTDDGVDDVLIGIPRLTQGSQLGGAIVVEGDLEGTVTRADAWTEIRGDIVGGRCGAAVDGIDTDGDGVSGVVLGCPNVDLFKGEIVVFDNTTEGVVSVLDADFRVRDSGAYRAAGNTLTHGDLNGDGYEDLVVGAPGGGNSSVSWPGAVYVFEGPITSSISFATASRTWQGESAQDGLGSAISAGDVDGDGDDEVLVGANRVGRFRGRAYLFDGDDGARGPITGAEATARLYGGLDGDNYGRAVGIVPDLDADGFDDVVVGAPGAFVTTSGAGIVYIFRGGLGY